MREKWSNSPPKDVEVANDVEVVEVAVHLVHLARTLGGPTIVDVKTANGLVTAAGGLAKKHSVDDPGQQRRVPMIKHVPVLLLLLLLLPDIAVLGVCGRAGVRACGRAGVQVRLQQGQ